MPDLKSHPCFISPQQLNPHLPLFVFLPGMDGTGQLLRTQTDSLETAFDVRCLAIPPDDLTTWDVLSEQVFALIQSEWQKQPQRSVYLCGESFGGCLAMKVALLHPEFFQRIILVNPASSFNQKPLLECATYFTEWIPDLFYRMGTYGLLPFLAALSRVAPRDRIDLLNAMKSVPPKTVHWRLSLLREFFVADEDLARLTPPVLLLAGAADRLLPSVAEAERLERILPNAKRRILSRSGHTCLLEEEVRLYEVLKVEKFLEADVPLQLTVNS